MAYAYQAVRLADKVYWVGAVDWAMRDFHGYLTARGTTYNAYLILAEKVTLIDAVKRPFAGEMLLRIASVLEPEKIDYIVSNHAEPDHTGALPGIIDKVKPEEVFASAMGVRTLNSYYGLEGISAVKDGEDLRLGDLTLSFMETKMLHWPDSMFSYLKEEEMLFSQDAFGMHLASAKRFADEIDKPVMEYEAAKYYANILFPFSSFVTKLLAKVASIGLKIRTLAPDHGPIYRTDEEIRWILDRYALWAARKPALKAVVAYDTMWGSSEKMAGAVAEGLTSAGVTPTLLPLRASHRSDAAMEILDAGALIVGSPTINNNMFPTVADLLTYIKGLKPKNLLGAAFGSYGWSGEAVKHIEEAFRAMGVKPAADSVSVRYAPADEDLARCHAMGRTVAESIKRRMKE